MIKPPDWDAQKAWDLYRRFFKDGEEVVVEDEDGDFHWGKLKSTNEGIQLTRPFQRYSVISWEEILFMAHDGFPVQKLLGMTIREAEQRAKDTPTKIIREFLVMAQRANPTYREFGGGCPFWFGPFTVEGIYNLGNNGPEWWGYDGEETTVLLAKDDAVCHAFDLSHYFFL